MLTVGSGDPNQRILGDTSWKYVDIVSNTLYSQTGYPRGKKWKKVNSPYFVDLTNIPTNAQIANWSAGGGGGGTITSVFGRPGPAITAQSGDYNFNQLSGSLASAQDYNTSVVAATYNNVTVNSTGRVTSGSNVSYITLLALSAVSPLSYNNSTGAFSIQTGSGSQAGAISATDWTTFNGKEPAISAGTTGQYWRGDKTWQTLNFAALSGSLVSGQDYNTTVTPGSGYNNFTVNATGRITAASTVAYLTGNQTITLSGDITGSGATAITTTIATVNTTTVSWRYGNPV